MRSLCIAIRESLYAVTKTQHSQKKQKQKQKQPHYWKSIIIVSKVLERNWRWSHSQLWWIQDQSPFPVSILIHALDSEPQYSLCMHWHQVIFLLPVSEKVYRREAFSCLSIPQISYNQIWRHFCFVTANDTSKSLSILIFHFFKLVMFSKLPEIVTMCFLVLCFPP